MRSCACSLFSHGRGDSSPRLAAICTTIFLAGCLLATRPTDARSPVIETLDRPWLHEAELDANRALHATAGQTVVLDLEGDGGSDKRGSRRLKRNRLRLFVEEPGSYRFCIPAEEPHITRLTLRSTSGWPGVRPRAHIRARPGGTCDPVLLAAGSYQLDIVHDARRVGAEHRPAFVRLAPAARLDSEDTTSQTDPLDDSLELAHMAFSYGGLFLSTNSDGVMRANASIVSESEIWVPAEADTGFSLANPGAPILQLQREYDEDGGPCRGVLFMGRTDCIPAPVTFGFSDAQGADFRLTAWSPNLESGTGRVDTSDPVNEGFAVYNESSGGALFTATMRALACTQPSCDPSRLTLQSGEVALYDSCSFDGVAFVYADDVEDFSVYDQAASQDDAIGDQAARAIRVGPATVVTLYTEADFGGEAVRVTDDIQCLDDVIDGVSSMKVEPGRAYVVGSNACPSCDLTGIDLSGLDLAGADFRDANLSDSKLDGSSLLGANLDGAKLNSSSLVGTDFLDTSLVCTDLGGNDLTTATFGVESTPITVVTDAGFPAVFSIEPGSGNRAILVENGTVTPQGLDASSQGLFFTDTSPQRILELKGDASILISSKDRGDGPRFLGLVDVALAGDESLVAIDVGRTSLLRVDRGTGDREILSGSGTGSGPAFQFPAALVINGSGDIFVTDPVSGVVFEVDGVTGDRTLLSGAGNGGGMALQAPTGIAIDSDGFLLVADESIPALLRVDPVSGDRTLLSGAGAGAGPSFSQLSDVAVASDGAILVVDTGLPGVIGVNADTGDRVIVSASAVGDGPGFVEPADIAFTDTASIAVRIATDLSCRLGLAGSSLYIDTLPPDLWRYADLTGATIVGAPGATLSSTDQPLDLRGAMLGGVHLSGVVLDGARLGCATTNSGAVLCTSLQATDLSGASLKAATLTGAQLQGASLSSANLDGADLTNAKLLGLSSGSPATLSGAFLRGAKLAKADLTGVIANNLNFYSISGVTADATDAVMTGAKFNNAYMAGADFSGATLQSTEWSQAVLVGANFTNADLSKNETAGEVTDFSNAYLHGTVFANANVTDANFDGSFWDLDPAATTTLNIELQRGNLDFAGFWGDPSAAECVQATYPSPSYPSPSTPVTDASNICPNGGLGAAVNGCAGVWEDAPIAIGEATPPGAVAPALPGSSCTTTDLCWLIVSSLCAPR